LRNSCDFTEPGVDSFLVIGEHFTYPLHWDTGDGVGTAEFYDDLRELARLVNIRVQTRRCPEVMLKHACQTIF